MAVEARVHSRLVDRRRRLSGTRENLGDYWSVHYWMCGVDSSSNTTKLINRDVSSLNTTVLRFEIVYKKN
jgi:ribosomal protein S6